MIPAVTRIAACTCRWYNCCRDPSTAGSSSTRWYAGQYLFISVRRACQSCTSVAGRVVEVRYQPGKFLPAFRADASDLNEQNSVILQAGETQCDRQADRWNPGPPNCVSCEGRGQAAVSGNVSDLIRFGSRVDIIIPPSLPCTYVQDNACEVAKAFWRHRSRSLRNPPSAAEAQPDRTLA